MELAALISLLGLKPHPVEGGFFVETYRSADAFSEATLPGRYQGPRCASTCIYYLLTEDSFSAMHRLPSDEIFHFYLGDPVELFEIHPDGSGRLHMLGTDLTAGMRPQHVVPMNTWQGSRLCAGGRYALLGTTVSPGFEFADFETGHRAALIAQYPQFAQQIAELTRT